MGNIIQFQILNYYTSSGTNAGVNLALEMGKDENFQ